MKVEKFVMNSTRNCLVRLQKEQKRALEKIRRDSEMVEVRSGQSGKSFFLKADAALELMDDVFDLEVGAEEVIKSRQEALRQDEQVVLEEIEALQSLLDGLSRDGITKVTYGLPRLCITSAGSNLGIPYLILTGIKKNALEKKSEGLTKVESKLLDYERRLADFIDEDYAIDPRQMTSFIGLYEGYLSTYYYENNMDMPGGNFERALDFILLVMSKYIIYKKTNMELKGEEYKNYVIMYMGFITSNPDFTRAGAIRKASEVIFERYANTEPAARPIKMSINKPLTVVNECDEKIAQYLENGTVVRVCNLEEFKKVLTGSTYNENRRLELYAQMRNLINRKAQEELDEKTEELKKSILTEEELELYRLAKKDYNTSYLIKDVDAIFEMFFDSVGHEDRAILLEDLDSLFEQIRTNLNVNMSAPKKEEIPRVVYYTEELIQAGETVKVPRVLTSILAMKGCNYKAVSNQLTKLLGGLTIGDVEVKREGLPCRVFVKGREVKTFYTFVGGTMLIIDTMRADGEEYKRVVKLVKTKEFREFLRNLQTVINSGDQPDARGYTNLITEELDRLLGNAKVKTLN